VVQSSGAAGSTTSSSNSSSASPPAGMHAREDVLRAFDTLQSQVMRQVLLQQRQQAGSSEVRWLSQAAWWRLLCLCAAGRRELTVVASCLTVPDNRVFSCPHCTHAASCCPGWACSCFRCHARRRPRPVRGSRGCRGRGPPAACRPRLRAVHSRGDAVARVCHRGP
jgi:hypothetical protein